MAAASSEVLALCALLFLCALVADSSAEGRNGGPLCVDGTYEHGGRLCCQCSAGQHLKEHCTANLQYGVCENCSANLYNIQPNSLDSCEPCTSCSHPNANLEVKEACTPVRDTKCRCKKDHYCSSDDTEKCRICHPCEVCPEGIKVACTANNNTVCKDKMEEGTRNGMIMGLVAIVLCVIGLASFFLFKRYRKRNGSQDIIRAPEAEMKPLTAQVVDLQPHLPDIAEIIGWKDMKEVATRSGIQDPVIESCQLDHPNDSQEQTLQLLKIWVEMQGKEASNMLVKILEENKKRGKAEKIIEQLSKPPA
ncbi:tumor necrosis factor receptor superfamily member 6-like [Pungitius pungitius]|uniref:tumor necrosis factor receptor superfamily member 6-like n=1 Tax=Pungitius pungitius TaxID=134920 RepID=UPI001887E3F5|nr:tumor necrosis factor receptor superfamily member 6-like [Pungitius pungitius]